MKHNLETFKQQFEKMPLYGKLREHDKRLTYGRYLTVLKEWWDKTKREAEGFEKKMRKLFDDFPLKEGTYEEYVKSVDEWLARARKEILGK